jgi:hypothetical protein
MDAAQPDGHRCRRESYQTHAAARATGSRAAAQARLAEALEQLREQGLEVGGDVGAPDPVVAVVDAWDPRRHDEIIVSTQPDPAEAASAGAEHVAERRNRRASRSPGVLEISPAVDEEWCCCGALGDRCILREGVA